MKKVCIFVFLLTGGLFLANAQDLIIMTDGNITEAIVIERTETEVRYRRYDNLTGPIHVLPLSFVLTIRYENGSVWLAAPAQGQGQPAGEAVQVTTISEALILVLNRMPPIRVAGNNLQFVFTVDTWVANVNGQPLFQGTIEYDGTDEGGTLTLKQTHMYPGAAAATAGRLARNIPGAGAVAGHVESAGQLAGGLVGAVEASGPEIVLEYRAGPPPSLSLLAYRGGDEDGRQRRGRGEGDESGASDDAWARKWFYLGAGFGGGSYKEEHTISSGGGYYDYYYNYWVPVRYYTYEDWNGMFAFGLTAEFALLPFLQFETGLLLGNKFFVPLLAKVGGKIPIRNGGMELSLDVGTVINGGFAIGGTLGFNAGPGILYARVLTADDLRFLGFVGYKVGLGREKQRMNRQ